MTILKKIFSFFLFLLVGYLAFESSFLVREDEQALLMSFGRISRKVFQSPGFFFKWPFWEKVYYFDKRILSWDGKRGEIPTYDNKLVWVDTTARWRISQPITFYKTVGSVKKALLRMGTILEGSTKDTISSYPLIEAVRNSNRIFENRQKTSQDNENSLLFSEVERIHLGREKLSDLIAAQARKELPSLGIELVDVQLRSIAYKEIVEKKVYQRMISESQKIASKIRAHGRQEESKILGQMEFEIKTISSEAYRKSQEIMAQAQKEAMTRLAQTLKGEEDYYSWLRSLENYKKSLAHSSLILSTQSPIFKDLSSKK